MLPLACSTSFVFQAVLAACGVNLLHSTIAYLWYSLTLHICLPNFAAVQLGCLVRQVTGVYFESKVDYTTWFGDNIEYIHGIQVTTLLRSLLFPVSSGCDERGAGILDAAVRMIHGVVAQLHGLVSAAQMRPFGYRLRRR